MNTTSTLTTTPKTCGCGCGELVARSFKPGHDGRLKGRLLQATKSASWWIREPAVVALVEAGWGHFVDSKVLAETPVRRRHAGRFVSSRHIDSFRVWEGYVNDEAGDTHAHRQCPSIQGKATWSRQPEGWVCSTCIHTQDYSEMVASNRLHTIAAKADKA